MLLEGLRVQRTGARTRGLGRLGRRARLLARCGRHGLDEALVDQRLDRRVGVAGHQLAQRVVVATAVDEDQRGAQPGQETVRAGLDLLLPLGCLAIDRTHGGRRSYAGLTAAVPVSMGRHRIVSRTFEEFGDGA
jgi:hypothetical protein